MQKLNPKDFDRLLEMPIVYNTSSNMDISPSVHSIEK